MARRQPSQEEVLLLQPKSYDVVDAFKCSVTIDYRISEILNHLLLAHQEKFATVEQEQASVSLHIYKELAEHTDGLPVAICCKIGERNYVLEAGSNSVDVLEKQVPKEIPSTTSGFIFYMQKFALGHPDFRFESSLQKGYCLAWNTEKKLTLKPKDLTDETQAFKAD